MVGSCPIWRRFCQLPFLSTPLPACERQSSKRLWLFPPCRIALIADVPTVILNSANALASQQRDFDRVVAESLRHHFASQAIAIAVVQTTSFDALRAALAQPGVLAVFTNLPPDSSYDSQAKPYTAIIDGVEELSLPANGYRQSIAELKAVRRVAPAVPLFVLTGAPREVVADEQIAWELGGEQLAIRRKFDLPGATDDYPRAYLTYILRHVLALRAPTLEYRRARSAECAPFREHQLGAIRVGLLTRDARFGHGVREVMHEICEFRAPAFDFELLTDAQVLHERLLANPPDMLLVASDGDYWLPMLAQLPQGHLQFGAAALTGVFIAPEAARPYVALLDLPQRVAPVALLEALIHHVQTVREGLRGDGWFGRLQSRFLAHLADRDDENRLYRALRSFAVDHGEVSAALRAAGGLSLFMPVQGVGAAEAVIRKAAVLADRTIFTQLPPSLSRDAWGTGTSLQMLRLWHTAAAERGTAIETAWIDLIDRHRPLFEAGRSVFFPIPSTVYITRDNIGRVAPELQFVREVVDRIPIAQESSGLLGTVTADTFGAMHCVDPSLAALSTVGRLVSELPLPMLENVDTPTLAKVLADQQDSVQAFRQRVRRAVDDLMASGSDLYSPLVIRGLARDLEDGAAQLTSEFAELRHSNAIQALGATLLTGVGTLSVVALPSIPATLLTVLGTGGLGAVGFQYLAYLQQLQRRKTSPYYFYWQLERRAEAG